MKRAVNIMRGFPFEEEEGSGAWSELAARHPDIAARLRQRPATWARKRRPSSHDATDDFGDSFGGFDRFPFDDIPPEFREHFPSHWNRRFGSRDEPQHTQHTQQSQSPPQQQTTATQTEQGAEPTEQDQQTSIPQYGLRNTVDLGQKSAADPSLVDADDRTQRSMSAPPDTPNQNKMSGQNHQEQAHQPPHAEQSNVRHIPIFVEGRDQPLINKTVDHGTHFGDTKPTYVPPPQQPHIDRDQYFADDGPGSFHPPPNFSRAFSTPFNKNFRQGPQPFVQQKVYPQTAFARGASPQRSQSPKPQMHPEEHYIKVPVHHDQPAQKTEPPSRAQKSPQQHQQPPPHQQQQQHAQHHPQQHPQQHAQHHPQQHHPQQHAPPQQPPQREQTPPQTKPQAPSSNDPITLILSIQTDVLNLMTEVENFTGSKKDKKYLFLDEMLTRNLIKLDNIETDGKENIRQARKEAIKCIQKCIAVLEAKADSQNAAPAQGQAQAQPEPEPQPQEQPLTQDVEMKENVDKLSEQPAAPEPVTENGEVEMKETTKEEKAPEVEVQSEKEKTPAPAMPAHEEKKEEPKPQDDKAEAAQPSDKEAAPAENKEVSQPQAADTRPDESKPPEENTESKLEEQKPDEKDKKASPKKVKGKKRDKSKDKASAPKDSNKEENVEQTDKKPEEQKEDKVEAMQVDDKGDKRDSQVMEVDAGASQ
ncbi:BAG domain-containing protein Samui isoform X3 [Manduca sexta]|uniref:BAG domain-containing protein n=1 Tax=Manduca sexta TaxID=7130 RepID=A0A921Z722_MANSE|nr:BAG domain-containing protein Samui isoform X3 [Manduca sexta]KAG6452130.1 hypothetical protein O3G_MSEX007483 [Manduca sexta]